MEYIVMDVETTVRCPIGNNRASPHWPENEIVLLGLKSPEQPSDIDSEVLSMSSDTMYVGHNIKFDLLHRYNSGVWECEEFRATGTVWDTQLAEYLLTGQRTKYARLDDLAVKYGGTLKDARIKEMWDAGVQTEDIPPELLREYLENDLINTELVFHAQIVEAQRLGMLPLIRSQMEALMATTEMEWNGLQFDSKRALTLMQGASKEMREIEKYLVDVMQGYGIPIPNLNSKTHISAVLFGGKIKEEGIETVMEDGVPYRYKTGARKGEVKTRAVTTIIDIKGMGVSPTLTTATKAGVYTVNEEVLSDIMDNVSGIAHVAAVKFCKQLLNYRGLHKDISTYYKPYIELVFPDGKIHGNINHCNTNTGRLASTNPNLQNVTNKEEE